MTGVQTCALPISLIAKNLMLAYKWGLKTVYYSLINKVGAKAEITGTNVIPNIAINLSDNVLIMDDEDCEACKL